MERAKLSRGILGGFIATLAMTAMIAIAGRMGGPKMDIAGMLGSMLSGQAAEPGSVNWLLGMAIHFLNGSIIFSLIYTLLYPVLKGASWLRGLEWGAILWFIALTMVMPMAGKGLFMSHTPQPMMYVAGSLMGHLLYGVILGAIAGRQAAQLPQPPGRGSPA